MLDRSYQNAFPFKLAATSYIFPDTWAGNVAKLAPYLDEIELIFFESAPDSLPGSAEIRELRTLAQAHGITYNIHLPIDLRLGSPEKDERRHAVETIRRLVGQTAILHPSTYTIHFDREADGPVDAWQDRIIRSMTEILDAGIPSQMFSAENLDFPLETIVPIVRELDLRICFDVGHLYLMGGDVIDAFESHRELTTIVHLYGIGTAGEHRSLDTMPQRLAVPLVERLHRFDGIVSMEVFSYKDLVTSLDRFSGLWEDCSGEDITSAGRAEER